MIKVIQNKKRKLTLGALLVRNNGIACFKYEGCDTIFFVNTKQYTSDCTIRVFSVTDGVTIGLVGDPIIELDAKIIVNELEV